MDSSLINGDPEDADKDWLVNSSDELNLSSFCQTPCINPDVVNVNKFLITPKTKKKKQEICIVVCKNDIIKKKVCKHNS